MVLCRILCRSSAAFFASKRRFSKRTQLRPSHCHLGVKITIFETNPTSPFSLSHRPQKSDLRNEPSFALRVVTLASKKRLTKRTQLPPSHCPVRLTERIGGNRRW